MLMLAALGKEPSIRNVSETVAKVRGRGMRWSVILDEMAAVFANRATVGQHPGNTDRAQIDLFGQHPGTLHAGARADLKGLSLDIACDSLRSSQAPVVAKKTRAQKLPLADVTEERSREILDLFWPLVAIAVGRSLTRAAWRQRNKLAARDFARVQRSDADLVEAHSRASKRLGSCVYSLRIVADELLRMDNPPVPIARAASRAQEASAVQIEMLRQLREKA